MAGGRRITCGQRRDVSTSPWRRSTRGRLWTRVRRLASGWGSRHPPLPRPQLHRVQPQPAPLQKLLPKPSRTRLNGRTERPTLPLSGRLSMRPWVPRQPRTLSFGTPSRHHCHRHHRSNRRRPHSSKACRAVQWPAPSVAKSHKAQVAAIRIGGHLWAVIAAFAAADIGFDIEPSGTQTSSEAGRGSDTAWLAPPPISFLEQSSDTLHKVPVS